MATRQVLRNTWLRRAIQLASGAPVDPTLYYRTLTRSTNRFRPEGMAPNEYILRAFGTYAFNNGISADFSQVFLVRNDAIVECLHFNLAQPTQNLTTASPVMPPPRKTSLCNERSG